MCPDNLISFTRILKDVVQGCTEMCQHFYLILFMMIPKDVVQGCVKKCHSFKKIEFTGYLRMWCRVV